MTTTVFVYGTLKSSHHNNRLLRNAKFLGEGITSDKYQTSCSGIPFVMHPSIDVEEKENHFVVGELYEVDHETLYDLDSLEGHPGWYKREEIKIISDHDKFYNAYCYLMPVKDYHKYPPMPMSKGTFYEF